jgi:predicted aminopeptidase
MIKARSIEDVINDSLVNDQIRERLLFIEKIRTFAIDSLGLKGAKNYTSFYDQGGEPLLWVLTASEPYRLKAWEWNFPVVGRVSYKGFFDKERGLREEEELKSRGYDTDYGEVSAWSTLGWFKDPVLSGMLKRSDGLLAELLIHELTHSTVYFKSDVNFNENLASAIGETGAEKFLVNEFGPQSAQLQDYLEQKEDADRYSRYMVASAARLDSLYTAIGGLDDSLKRRFKNELIEEIVGSIDTIGFNYPDKYRRLFRKSKPGNAYFLNFIRYDSQKEEMRKVLKESFGDDISLYIDHIRKKYK